MMQAGVRVLGAALLLLLCMTSLARAQAQPELECAPPQDPATATLPSRADEHFKRGNELYLGGQYEQAIAEFEAAYCLIPAAEAAYNIAQSFMGLVDYEHAIAWLSLYARLLPTGAEERRRLAENRIDRLRKLPARVRVASEPSGARVTLSGVGGKIVGRTGSEPLEVPAGDYSLEVGMTGYESVHEDVQLRIGQPYTFSYRLAVQEGQVRVTTEPFTARIFIDSKLVGVGTYVDGLPVGRHQLTVEAEGRPSHDETVEVRAGTVSEVHVRLPAARASGRWELVSAAAALGTAAGSTIGDSLVDTDSSRAFLTLGAAGLAVTSAYVGIPENISVGTSSFILGSALWAGIQSLSASYILTLDEQSEAAVIESSVVVASLVSALVAPRLDLSAGDAALLNSGVLWGTGMGLLLWGVFDREQDLSGAYMIAGSNLGILAGIGLGARFELSRGHVALIDLSGVTGMFLGLVIAQPIVTRLDSITAGDDTRLHFALGGTLLGLTLGALFTRDLDEPRIPRSLRGTQAQIGATTDAAGKPITTFGLGGSF
jgi:hypothetical protein